jgi:hypothetical protein
MKIRIIILLQLILFSIGCQVQKTVVFNSSQSYGYSDVYADYQIRFVNDSILVILQNFKCEKLPDSLKHREITALYKQEKPIVLRNKLFIEPYGRKKVEFVQINLINLSQNKNEYPNIEGDGVCSIFNELNRFDRKVYDGRTIFSLFNKANIIDFNEAHLHYRVDDDRIGFGLKSFKRIN